MPFRITPFRNSRLNTALLTAMLLAGVAGATTPAHAQDQGAPPSAQADDGSGQRHGRPHDETPATPLPWQKLSPEQRDFLKPMQAQWDKLPPRRQQHMAAHVEHWMQLPPERRAQIQQRMTRWAQMSPQERAQAAHNAGAFQKMTPEDQQHVADVFQRFQSLTPAQKQALRQKFREMRQDERRNGAASGQPDGRAASPASPSRQP